VDFFPTGTGRPSGGQGVGAARFAKALSSHLEDGAVAEVNAWQSPLAIAKGSKIAGSDGALQTDNGKGRSKWK
jgi:hypothetical protein